VVNLKTILAGKNLNVAEALVDFILQQTNVKVHILSYGPSSKDKKFVSPK